MAEERLKKLIQLITTNPTVRRNYYTNPQGVLERMIPEREEAWAELRAELGGRAEDAITEDPDLVSERNEHFEAYKPARLIAHNPKLRTKYFENPCKVLARAIPRRGLRERISLAVPNRIRKLRAELGEKVEAVISNDPRLISDREAAVEKNVFLSEALQNPQRTFNAILRLSILASLISILLLIGTFFAAGLGDGTTEKAVLSALFGTGGAASTLTTLFLISRDSIRMANGDNAQIRLILTGFATEMAHYRGITIDDFDDAKKRNKEIRKATIEAVETIEKYAEPKEEQPEEQEKQSDTEGAEPETAGTG